MAGAPSLVGVLDASDTTVVGRVLARAADSGRQGDALRGKVEERVEVNLFQNAKKFRRKNSAATHAGFHPILSQDPKEFGAGTSVEG